MITPLRPTAGWHFLRRNPRVRALVVDEKVVYAALMQSDDSRFRATPLDVLRWRDGFGNWEPSRP